jgi:hypothetical protein
MQGLNTTFCDDAVAAGVMCLNQLTEKGKRHFNAFQANELNVRQFTHRHDNMHSLKINNSTLTF